MKNKIEIKVESVSLSEEYFYLFTTSKNIWGVTDFKAVLNDEKWEFVHDVDERKLYEGLAPIIKMMLENETRLEVTILLEITI